MGNGLKSTKIGKLTRRFDFDLFSLFLVASSWSRLAHYKDKASHTSANAQRPKPCDELLGPREGAATDFMCLGNWEQVGALEAESMLG